MSNTAINPLRPQRTPESTSAATANPEIIEWSAPGLSLSFGHSEAMPLHLLAFAAPNVSAAFPAPLPLVEILAVGRGHTLASGRLVQTSVGAALRYLSHETDEQQQSIRFRLGTPDGILAELTVSGQDGAIRASVTVTNGTGRSLALTAVASLVSPLGTAASGPSTDSTADWLLIEGANEWLGEGRWTQTPLRGLLPGVHHALTGGRTTPRSGVVRTADGTWSTAGALPTAGAVSRSRGLAWLWEIPRNGPWRWEVGEHLGDCYLALSGPTDRDHQWMQILAPDESFTTVPALLCVGRDLPEAAAALTSWRRQARRAHPDNARPSIVFNDYMNTLNGDPSTEKLLPLIDAAAAVGAEIYCIDAGWYSDSTDWWDGVGAWTPSVTRFPNGLGEVIAAIRSHAMVPGLWLEPEVVGVNSPAATALPDEAFLRRGGIRVEEDRRHHLDLRHPAARAHLDRAVDRLVAEFGIGYFKFDYNIDGGPGTDRDAPSVGAGLLGHNRAHLAWIDGVLQRHPHLILENCASGGLRAAGDLLARMHVQSTSDQQDPLLYPPIAASAPLSMLPETAANWAYPQPEMSPEECAFTLATGLAGRFYLSGHLNRMSTAQLALVREAVDAARALRPILVEAVPSWPIGLPGWDDRWIASALHGPTHIVLSLWDRGGDSGKAILRFPALAGRPISVDTVFPRSLPAWETQWNPETGTLTVRSTVSAPTARTLILTPSAPTA
ncbi:MULTISPECIES: glycoside hydrolase family 36 protein [Arthrobacter]|uniref:Alpha-galactosidase n=1 Tax=Arthrobacter terricola TaxID=2547396 RepID=A0A4V2ZRY5_9MICC|nr:MULTISPECIES: glycoside hydrolase family 36 protein [Arthrobacter]MBT8163281.1 alpha-galactosidase [Arthrobacter sp. GN70]TDF91194.1 alpha-galactosidase [Arthrobacter terricola]